MNVLIATSECAPFAKTGGLADVCGALPLSLVQLGHEASVIMPAHRIVRQADFPIEPTGIELAIPIGRKTVTGRLLKGFLQGDSAERPVPIYFVEQDDYFDRASLYGEGGRDYPDNCERFVFFCRAVLEAVQLLDLRIDILHANDWTTGLIPAYLKIEHAGLPPLENVASLFTIHNLAYQGSFWHWDMLLTGLDWKYFNWRQMEFHGKLNLMKTALVFAEAISTVSPRYAEEIQTAPLGCGLEGILSHRRDILSGIVNGVNEYEWDPAGDPHLPANYDVETVGDRKPKCKAALQEEFGLPQRPDVPLVAFIGRFAEQKGIHFIAAMARDWMGDTDVQWVVLGTGDPAFEERFRRLAAEHPDKLAARIEFSERLAHRIEAGADMLIMPSRYEPCGLSQLYSLKYGTVPVVRRTGGLADTITDTNDTSLAAGTANGFSFDEHTQRALSAALRRACEHYATPEVWRKIVRTGMRQDWSWTKSARKYVEVYEKTVALGRGQRLEVRG